MYMKIHKCRLEEFEGHCGLCILINNINFNIAFTPQWKSKCQNSNETSNNFVQRNIRLIFHFVDQESLPSATLRWLFGSYQSCNNLSTHSIHENFWGFRAAWFSFRSCLCTAYSKKEQILQENENCGPYTFAAWTNIHQPRHVTLFQNSEKWILKKYMWWAVWGRNQGAPQKPIDRSWNLSEKNSLSSMLLLG